MARSSLLFRSFCLQDHYPEWTFRDIPEKIFSAAIFAVQQEPPFSGQGIVAPRPYRDFFV